MTKLSGREAIEYAKANGLNLNKYADQTEDAMFGLSIGEANVVAQEDPDLIWIDADNDPEDGSNIGKATL